MRTLKWGMKFENAKVEGKGSTDCTMELMDGNSGATARLGRNMTAVQKVSYKISKYNEIQVGKIACAHGLA